ncbi:MAG TPA: hypothetical protein IAB92_04125 [Candidatus Faecousia faecigallinarum]|nr:hypothetical protein [Candidatus Faecousia faecigallinarum]
MGYKFSFSHLNVPGRLDLFREVLAVLLRHQISKSHINAGGASNMPTAVIVVIDGNKANAKERKDVLQIVADLQIATPKPGEIIAPNVLALADTLPSSACHCEPVGTPVAIRSPRRETWQPGTTLGEFMTPYEFAQSTALCYAPPQEKRIATSLCSSQ